MGNTIEIVIIANAMQRMFGIAGLIQHQIL